MVVASSPSLAMLCRQTLDQKVGSKESSLKKKRYIDQRRRESKKANVSTTELEEKIHFHIKFTLVIHNRSPRRNIYEGICMSYVTFIFQDFIHPFSATIISSIC